MRAKFAKELARLGLPRGPSPDASGAPVTEAEIEALPNAVKRYLRFMGVPGRPRDWSFRLAFTGRFRRTPQEPWMRCNAIQYNTRLGVARIFYLQIRMAGILPVLGRDTYMNGQGRMLIRPLDLFTIGDGKGEEFSIGELVTYLNDGIMIAPSMLLVPEVRWADAGNDAFDICMDDAGRTVRARVFVDERGAPVDFSTTDRFLSDPKDVNKTTRMEWRTPISGWREENGRKIWTNGQAVWQTPEGPFPYAVFTSEPGSLAFNIPPDGSTSR